MKRDHSKISPTAFNHIIWRTFYCMPFAREFLTGARKYWQVEHILHKKFLSKKSKTEMPKIVPIFEGRYRGGEKALENFIRKNPECTVCELAAGFSLHGENLSRKYPKITYIETDLPEMIKLKEKIVRKIGAKNSNLYFRSTNALDGKKINGIFGEIGKPKSKVAFYCEGLMSYFSDEEKRKLAGIIREILSQKGGVWIAPDPALSLESRGVLKKHWPDYKRLSEKVEKIARQKYDDHGFQNEKETDKLFRDCGFKIKKISWPTKLHSLKTAGYEKKQKEKLRKILKKFGKVWVLSV